MQTTTPTVDHVVSQTRAWVEQFIVPLNICPFAKREVERATIRYRVAELKSDEALYDVLVDELTRLDEQGEIETTLLILPQLNDDFERFLNMAGYGQQILALEGYSGDYQLANFHPHYVFTDSDESDPANYTNRAPHACLHLLREASLERVIRAHKNADQIPAENIEKLRELGLSAMQAYFAAYATENK